MGESVRNNALFFYSLFKLRNMTKYKQGDTLTIKNRNTGSDMPLYIEEVVYGLCVNLNKKMWYYNIKYLNTLSWFKAGKIDSLIPGNSY